MSFVSKMLTWIGNNKFTSFLILCTIGLIASTWTLAKINADLKREIDDLNSLNNTVITTTNKPPVVTDPTPKTMKNIVLIMADDLGFNDLSFRGSNEIPTPNIDALAYNGVIMDRFYTPSLCSPSRASLMTGKYPFHVGMQNFVLSISAPYGLSLDEKVLPQYLKEAGYATHLIGKWHLGFFQEAYMPTKRGYDTHYGYLGDLIDYFDHTKFFDINGFYGRDFRRNLNTSACEYGQYATDLFTSEAVNIINQHDPTKPLFLQINHLAVHSANNDDPLQGKKEDIEKLSHITDENRRIYASMVSALDQSVGAVVEALSEKNLLDDTLMIFYSDNGGQTALAGNIQPNNASNYPLRGIKGYGWEGAMRVPGIFFAPWLPKGEIREEFLHVVDLMPTMFSLANVSTTFNTPIDGMDLSSMILNEAGPLRTEVVQIDDARGLGAIISNGFKLVNGSLYNPNGDPNLWWGTNENNLYNSAQYIPNVQASKVAQALSKYSSPLSSTTITNIRSNLKVKCVGNETFCDIYSAPCLFDIINDPCEEVNLAESLPEIYESLKEKYAEHVESAVPFQTNTADPASNPANFNLFWSPWK